MPVDRKDLEARLAAATPQDTVRGLIFNATFDTVESHLGKAAALACDPTGKGRRTDFFSYPVADYLQITAAAADRLEPELGSIDQAWFAMGHRSVAGVFLSTLGATLIALSGKSPRALLGQAAMAYRGTVSYGERRLEWLGDRHARFVFTRDFLVPAYHCGVFTSALEAMGAKAPRVTGEQVSLLDASYDMRWE